MVSRTARFVTSKHLLNFRYQSVLLNHNILPKLEKLLCIQTGLVLLVLFLPISVPTFVCPFLLQKKKRRRSKGSGQATSEGAYSEKVIFYESFEIRVRCHNQNSEQLSVVCLCPEGASILNDQFLFPFLSVHMFIVTIMIYLEITILLFAALLARMTNHLYKVGLLSGENMEIVVCILV
jgi:hypothetical protein